MKINLIQSSSVDLQTPTSGACLCDYCKGKKITFIDIFEKVYVDFFRFYQLKNRRSVEQDEKLGICGIYQTKGGENPARS